MREGGGEGRQDRVCATRVTSPLFILAQAVRTGVAMARVTAAIQSHLWNPRRELNTEETNQDTDTICEALWGDGGLSNGTVIEAKCNNLYQRF